MESWRDARRNLCESGEFWRWPRSLVWPFARSSARSPVHPLARLSVRLLGRARPSVSFVRGFDGSMLVLAKGIQALMLRSPRAARRLQTETRFSWGKVSLREARRLQRETKFPRGDGLPREKLDAYKGDLGPHGELSRGAIQKEVACEL